MIKPELKISFRGFCDTDKPKTESIAANNIQLTRMVSPAILNWGKALVSNKNMNAGIRVTLWNSLCLPVI